MTRQRWAALVLAEAIRIEDEDTVIWKTAEALKKTMPALQDWGDDHCLNEQTQDPKYIRTVPGLQPTIGPSLPPRRPPGRGRTDSPPPGAAGGGGLMPSISEAFALVVDLARGLGASGISKLDGCWEHALGERWRDTLEKYGWEAAVYLVRLAPSSMAEREVLKRLDEMTERRGGRPPSAEAVGRLVSTVQPAPQPLRVVPSEADRLRAAIRKLEGQLMDTKAKLAETKRELTETRRELAQCRKQKRKR